MLNLKLENVKEATGYAKVTPGAYICRIITVEDIQAKECLKITYDIAQGELEGYYSELFDSKGFWGANFAKSYKEKALPYFKQFVTVIETSNKNYKWDNDETKLVNKLVGLVIGEESYPKADGTQGVRLYVNKIVTVDDVKKGGTEIPKFKGVKINEKIDDMTLVDDGAIPF